MEPTAQQLFASALHLPDSERAELAARLIESLDSQVAETGLLATPSQVTL